MLDRFILYYCILNCFVWVALLWKHGPGCLSQIFRGQSLVIKAPNRPLMDMSHNQYHILFETTKEDVFLINVILDLRACHSLWKCFIWDKEATFWATEEKEVIAVRWSTVWATSPERATGGASTETLSYSYRQTSSPTGSLCVFVYRKKKLVCPLSLLGNIMSKWEESNAASTWCSSGRCLPESSPTEDWQTGREAKRQVSENKVIVQNFVSILWM